MHNAISRGFPSSKLPVARQIWGTVRGADGPFFKHWSTADDDYRLGFKGLTKWKGRLQIKRSLTPPFLVFLDRRLMLNKTKIATCSIELKLQTQSTYFI
jgi:hypothetical protein